MAHVKRYARENGVTIREAMSLACQTYKTGCRSRQGSPIPNAPSLGYAPGLVYNPPAMGGPRSRVSQGNILGGGLDDLLRARNRLRASGGIPLAARLASEQAARQNLRAPAMPYVPNAPPLGMQIEGHRYYRHRR